MNAMYVTDVDSGKG